MTKVGIIGCGGMGNFHGNCLAEMHDVEVVAVCDLIEAKARDLGDRIGARPCVDYHNLLDDVEAVLVCTEPFHRVDILAACAAAGKQIFCEKPIALNLADADATIAAAREAGVLYMLGYCLRFTQPFKRMRECFASGELGELVSCWTRRFMPADMTGVWFGEQDKSGGVLLDFGSHDIDWMRWIGGEAKTVLAGAARVRETVHADEHGAAFLLFENGGMGAAEVSWSWHLDESSLGVVGAQGAIIVGRDGVVRKKVAGRDEEIVDVESAMAVDVAGHVGEKDASGAVRAVAAKDETILEHFFRCIREGIEPLTPAEDGRRTLATVLAIHESVRRGAGVDVAEIG